MRSDYYEELILPLEYRKGHLGKPVRVKKTTHIDNSWKCLECHEACHVYTYHATFTPEMRADELMQKMWDEDVEGISDQNKRFTAWEVPAARKKRHNQGVMLRDSEVAIPWKDEDTPLCSNRKTAEDRLISRETPSAKARGC